MDKTDPASDAYRSLMKRRGQLYIAEGRFAPEDDQAAGERWGICLSGGGIRSATYSLGVMQSLARSHAQLPDREVPDDPPVPLAFVDSLLSRFDYLSTVSGGGYTGSAIGSMFVPGRLCQLAGGKSTPDAGDACVAADAALRALSVDPPGRILSAPSGKTPAVESFPLAWLRDNGRYLSPTGAGDLAYAAALDFRNWVAIHYVFGTLLVMLFSALALLRSLVPGALDTLPPADSMIWWSPLILAAVVPLALWAFPVGLAFWFTYPSRTGTPPYLNWAVAGALGIDVLLAVLYGLDTSSLVGDFHPRNLLLLAGFAMVSLAIVFYAVLRTVCDPNNVVASLRVLATRWLLAGLQASLLVFALGAIETVGQSLFLAAQLHDMSSIWGATGVAGALVWIARHVLNAGSGARLPDWVRKVPLPVIGGAAGILIFVLIACLWSCFVTWVIWDGSLPTAPAESTWMLRGVIFVVALALAWVTGQFPGFINLSSLQSFYSARLTRAYLGASNRARFHAAGGNDKKLSAAEPVEGDDVSLTDYVDKGAPRTLAPLHLINTTLNKTVDPSEQLVQRDRKGQSFAVTPLGFLVDGSFHKFDFEAAQTEIQRPLSVGGWVGVSGAAASTGIGRDTSLGMSLLLGAANVRLGSWWESDAKTLGPERNLWRRTFRTQAYLLDEFTARFYGLERPWQYLTDGGHFENLGLYELLRPQRRLQFAVIVDAGADPDYAFGDLANLIRLARIDFRVEVDIYRGPLVPELAAVFATPDLIRAQEQSRRSGPVTPIPPLITQCAVLLKVTYPKRADAAWVVMMKPRVLSSSAPDVRQYALTHPAFPQEPTGDQFFDEAQWESYRKLGLSNAAQVLDPRVRAALQTLIATDLGVQTF